MQRLHAQNHASERTAQNFGIGKTRPGVEVVLLVQPDANAVGNAAATPGALVGGRLADWLDQQLLDLAAQAVALHARGAGVDHVADAWHRERGLSHIGREHDAPAAVVVKNAVLLGLRQAGKQRQHIGIAKQRLMAQMPAQMIGCLADFALARQEHQNVAAVVHVAP